MVVFPWSMWAIMPISRMSCFLVMSLIMSLVCRNLGIFGFFPSLLGFE